MQSDDGGKQSRVGARTGQKLRVRGIKAAKHTGTSYGEVGGGAKQEILWVTDIPGLGLRVVPSGGGEAWHKKRSGSGLVARPIRYICILIC